MKRTNERKQKQREQTVSGAAYVMLIMGILGRRAINPAG